MEHRENTVVETAESYNRARCPAKLHYEFTLDLEYHLKYFQVKLSQNYHSKSGFGNVNGRACLRRGRGALRLRQGTHGCGLTFVDNFEFSLFVLKIQWILQPRMTKSNKKGTHECSPDKFSQYLSMISGVSNFSC